MNSRAGKPAAETKRAWHGRLPLAASVALPLVVGLFAHSQGFNLLDDGIWLLGGQTIADGGLLHRDLFTLYGAGRFILLLPLFIVFGKSALSLAILKALLDAAASGFGFFVARKMGAGRLAWLVPLGVLALGPLDPRNVAAGMFAIGVGLGCGKGITARRPFVLGVSWGLMSWLGLDAALFGFIIAGSCWLIVPESRLCSRATAQLLAGFALTVLIAFVPALVTGSFSEAVWQTVVYPVTRFHESMRLSWFQVFTNPGVSLRPFAEVFTGETLSEAFPYHAELRTTAVRALYVTLWLVAPLAILTEMRGSRRPLVIAIGGFAATGMLAVLGRGDVAHLKSAWLGSLWLLPVVMARPVLPARVRAVLAGIVAVLVLLPLAVEPLWMAGHVNRVGLALWKRPEARIRTSSVMITEMERLYSYLGASQTPSAAIWPAYPGIHALLDIPVSCPNVTLLTAGEVRDPRQLCACLEESCIEQVLIGYTGFTWFASGMTLERLEPQLWSCLRQNFRVERIIAGDFLRFKVLKRVAGGLEEIRRLPLAAQLNDREFSAWNGNSPSLAPGMDVGQSFRVGPIGFSGFGVSFNGTPGDSLSVRISVYAQAQGEQFALLATQRRDFVLRSDKDFQYFTTGPIENTAERLLVVSFELLRPSLHPVSLLWYMHDRTKSDADFCPDGHVFVRKQPVDADLYFLSY